MMKWWKVNINVTILNQFTGVIIVKANTDDEAKIRAYNKAKHKYKTASKIDIISIKKV